VKKKMQMDTWVMRLSLELLSPSLIAYVMWQLADAKRRLAELHLDVTVLRKRIDEQKRV